LTLARGIEISHIFQLGRKYTEAFDVQILDEFGKRAVPTMGSYGIGVSRLVAVIAEQMHDETGIIWPASVAPFHVGLINLKAGDGACDEACNKLHKAIKLKGLDVLCDDRDERAGVKFADMDLIGLPWQVIVGPKGVAKGMVELKNRRTGAREELSMDAVITKLTVAA